MRKDLVLIAATSAAILCSAILAAPARAVITQGYSLEDGDYRDDFQGTTPAAGWQYLWNQPTGWTDSGTFGNGTTNDITAGFGGFAALQWTGSEWTADGDGTGGDNQPSGFNQLNATGGHPALGSTQNGGDNNNLNRYVIAAYTVTQGGEYEIDNSFIDRGANVSGSNTPVDARVFVNSGGSEIGAAVTSSGASVTFDRALNILLPGDTVYVGAGPDGQAGSDAFTWDFTVQQTRFDISGGQTESDTDIRLIEEQIVTLGSDLTVDAASLNGISGTFGPSESVGSDVLPAGLEVTSHILHFDPATGALSASGTFTFDNPIVGLIFEADKLDTTDALFGLSDIIYPTDGDAQTTNFRGALNEGTDQLIISADRRTINLTMFAGSGNSVDQIRILTAPAMVPEPSTAVLCLLGFVMGLGGVRARRR